MKDNRIANDLINTIIDIAINKNNEDEMKAGYEWKQLELTTKVKVIGIIAYWTGNTQLKSLFEAAKKIEKEMGS